MTVSRRRLAQTIVRLLRDQPQRRQLTLQAVAAYLIVHKQAKQLDLLANDIARELQQVEGRLAATVHSAFALNDASRSGLKTYLQQATGAKAIQLEEMIDPTLLSGVVVRTADHQLDLSVRSALRRLARLNSEEYR